jgi:hypothetical protein
MRPRSLAVVAYFLIAAGVAGLIGNWVAFSHGTSIQDSVMRHRGGATPSPLRLDFQTAIKDHGRLGVVSLSLELIGPFAVIISGVCLLAGYGWARWLYLGFSGGGACLRAVSMQRPDPVFLVVGVSVWILIAYLLTKPSASEFFETRRTSRING